jgi:hypothetical protein
MLITELDEYDSQSCCEKFSGTKFADLCDNRQRLVAH